MQYAPSLTNGAAYDWTIEILGVQLELGSVATSFVPTSTAAATANADNAAISVSDFAPIWSAVENTVYCEFELRKNATGLQQSILDLHNGTSDERVQIVVSSAGNVSLFVHAGAVPVVNQTLGAAIVGRNKVAARIKANDMTGALNGVVQAADTSCPIPAVTRAQIGANRAFTANTIMNGWIPVARNILRGLSNSSLASLTD